jgi:hypothetical protein
MYFPIPDIYFGFPETYFPIPDIFDLIPVYFDCIPGLVGAIPAYFGCIPRLFGAISGHSLPVSGYPEVYDERIFLPPKQNIVTRCWN